jgi:hypothetical protein
MKWQGVFDKLNYDLAVPEWYWDRSQWNRLKVEVVAAKVTIKRINMQLTKEEYPSCIVENW